MNRSLSSRPFAALALVAALAGCHAKQDVPQASLTPATGADSAHAIAAAHALLGADAKAALDRGNVAFRKQDFKAALAEYQTASTLAPQHSAPLFGIYMVGKATNDTAMANKALAGIRERGGAMPPSTPHAATGAMGAPHATIAPKKAGT